MEQDWSIQKRNDRCAVTGKVFEEGEQFVTVLYEEAAGFRREDLSEAAWQERQTSGALPPYSFWRSRFEAAPPPAPEPLGSHTAEEFLREYMADPTPQHANARYILAVMLERKRLLKETAVKHGEDGSLMRFYEHTKTGELFVVPDPQLRLDQIEEVQTQMSELLPRT